MIDPKSCDRRTLLKGMAAGSAALVFGDTVGSPASAASQKLPRSSPEGVGIDPAGVLGFINGVNEKLGGLHGLILMRHGQVAAEGWWAPYAPEYPHQLYSLSKSFCSTAVGLAVQQGLLTVEAPVISFFKDQLPATVPDNLKAMQVKHLLMMGTGHERDATNPMRSAPGGDWVKAFLSLPVEHAPGSRFVYNSAATYMCSAIVQKVTNATVLDYLKPRLFEPLGIESPTWETCPKGISTGGWGLNIRTEDIARFGQMYLQKGKWNGKQLVPEAWVAEATSKHIPNGANPSSDWNQGYGYQFWRCRHNAYRGDGAFGQYCVVMPEQDAVLAINSGLGDMQAVLNLAWEHLLPAMKPETLPGGGGSGELKRKRHELSVPPPMGTTTSPTAKRITGRDYLLEPNDEKITSVRPSFDGGRCTVVMMVDRNERRIRCGSDTWLKGTAALGDNPEAPVAARGAWQNDDTYVMKVCFVETPFVQTMTWKFTGDAVTIDRKMNVGFGPTERPTLRGKGG
jgi:CubicO group peptidase (beta-lactamase class C family)